MWLVRIELLYYRYCAHYTVFSAVVQTRSGGWPYFVVNTSWSSWWWPEGWPSFSKILTSWWWTSWWWLRGGFRDFGGVTKCTHSPVKRVKVVVFRGETHPWWWPPPPPPRGWIWTSWWWPPTSWFGAKSWWRWPWTEFAPQRFTSTQGSYSAVFRYMKSDILRPGATLTINYYWAYEGFRVPETL